MKQAVAAQKRRTSKARETTRAELELAFFCIAGEMGALVVAYGPERVNVFRTFPDVVRHYKRRETICSAVPAKLRRDLQLIVSYR
jgi:hypothetical protein